MSSSTQHTGRCLCGGVRYAVQGPTVWSAGCCCESCTRAAGAPIIVWTGFKKSGFRLIMGKLKIYESSPGVRRGFCPDCGTTLTYQKDARTISGAQDDIYISTRTLDEPEIYPPTEHVNYGEHVEWFSVGDGLPCHDTVSPENAHRMLASMSREQGEKL